MDQPARSIEVRYEYDADASSAVAEIVDAANVQIQRSLRQQWIRRWLNWPSTLLLFYGLAFYHYDGWLAGTGVSRHTLLVGGISASLVLLAWFCSGLFERRNPPPSREILLCQARAAGRLGPVAVTVCKDNVGLRSDVLAAQLAWSQVERIDTTTVPEYIVLVTRLGFAVPVPRNAFADTASAETFLALAIESLRASQHAPSPTGGRQTVSFDPTFDDLVAIRRYYVRQMQGRYRRSLWFALACIPFVLLVTAQLLAAILFFARGIVLDRLAMAILGTLSVCVGLMPAFLYWRGTDAGLRQWARWQIRRRKVDPRFFDQKQVTISDEGLRVFTSGIDGLLPWNELARVVVAGDRLLLCVAHSQQDLRAYVVPSVAFESEQLFIEFCATAESYWQAAHPD